MGDIDIAGDYRAAARGDLTDIGIDQAEHDIDIVDHQIQNYIDFRAARLIRRQPLGVNFLRFGNFFFQRDDRRIKPLEMTDLQQHVVFFRTRNQGFGFADCFRYWLFEQYMDTRVQTCLGQGEMKFGRHHDRDQIHLTDNIFEARVSWNLIFFCDLSPTLGIRLNHCDQINIFQSEVLLDVKVTQVANADDCRAKLFHNRI